MSPAIFRRRTRDSGGPKTADRTKSAGAREYDARVHERTAERMSAAGDSEGARLQRAAAAELRLARSAAARTRKPVPLAGAGPGVYRIYR